MEDVCEYLPGCLRYLWEGKTEGLVFIRTPQADASLKKTHSAQTFIAFLLPFVLNMHTGYFPSCGSEASICCVESRL